MYLSIPQHMFKQYISMLESSAYVWKIKKYGDEESSSVANERCPRGSAANDHGNDGKETRIIPKDRD